MSLDKSINNGSEHRKPYRKSRAFDRSCRNHGKCGYCHGNRMYKHTKRIAAADYELNNIPEDEFTQSELAYFDAQLLEVYFLNPEYESIDDFTFEELTELIS